MNAELIFLHPTPNGQNERSSVSRFLSREVEAFGMDMPVSGVAAEPSELVEYLHAKKAAGGFVIISSEQFNDDAPAICAAVCDVLHTEPLCDADSLGRVTEYCKNTGSDIDGREILAVVPAGCTVFPNEHGITPGYVLVSGGFGVLVLPGTPRELFPMFSDFVSPFLTNHTDGTVISHMVGVFGLSESSLVERLAGLLSEANPSVTIYSKDGEAFVRVTARSTDRASADRMCDDVVAKIRQLLGVHVYGVDIGSLQKAVVILLLDKGLKIATAESCTAGLLSTKLTEVSGVSSVFECGVAAYSPEIKRDVLGVPSEILEEFGAVSAQSATAMATGVRKLGKASLGISITGVAGPDPSEGKPVGTVYIALADEKRVWVKRVAVSNPDFTRDSIRNLATVYALDLVRRYLEALPTIIAGGELLPVPEPEQPVIPQTNVTPRRRHFFSRILPWKGDSPAAAVFKSVIIAGFLALIGIIIFIFYSNYIIPRDNRDLYSALVNMYTESSFVPSENISYPDSLISRFGALYTHNQDVRGWVKISGTGINYPFMKNDPFYKIHNFDRQPSVYGAPYLIGGAIESPVSDFRAFVIDGNNRDGQMFSDLCKYDSLDFLRQHPVIVTDTLYAADMHWQIFSVMLAAEYKDDAGRFNYTRASFWRENADAPDSDFLEHTGRLAQRSLYTFPSSQSVVEGDTILLLTTQYSSGEYSSFRDSRIVVAARLLRDGEQQNEPDLSDVTLNRNVLMPQEYYDAVSGDRITTTGTHAPPSSEPTASFKPPDYTDEKTASEDLTSEYTSQTETLTAATKQPTGTAPSSTGVLTTPATTHPSTETSTTPTTHPPDAVYGRINESEFMSIFRFQNSSGTTYSLNGSIEEQKSQLQMYLARIVKAECGSSDMMANDLAAQKAQAIASYTLILYTNKLGGTETCPTKEIVLSNPTDKKIYDAVGSVLGYKILAGDLATPLYTPFYAASPGYTIDNRYVFGSNLSHLRSVESKYDSQIYSGWSSTCTVSLADLLSKTKSYLSTSTWGKSTARYSGQELLFDSESGKPLFHVRNYDVDSGLFTMDTSVYFIRDGAKFYIPGRIIRASIGTTTLRSHSFKVASSTDTSVTLTVQGYGHGVGMSQYGAAGYAKYENWGFRQILSHYYSINSSSSHKLVAPIW